MILTVTPCNSLDYLLIISYKDQEFTITSGIINFKSESKDKQVCLSVISTKLPTNVQIKAHELVLFGKMIFQSLANLLKQFSIIQS